MHSSEERKLLEIARLLNEHKGKKGMAPFICKELKVSGKDVGKVKRMMDDGLLIFDDNKPRLIVPRDIEYFLLGKVFVEWTAKRKIKLQGITDNLINEVVTKALDEYGPRKPGRPKGSSIKPQLKILCALMGGSKSFQGIVDATKLPRNTVSNNLRSLNSMEMVMKNKIGGRAIYQIDPIRFLFFFKFLALKGNIKAKKATSQKRMKPIQNLLRCTIKLLPEIVELWSNQPELMNSSIYDTLHFAAERYSIKRENYSIKRGKRYLPSHPQRQILKVKEACSSLGDNTNKIIEEFLKSTIESIIETENVKKLVLSGRARHLSLKND